MYLSSQLAAYSNLSDEKIIHQLRLSQPDQCLSTLYSRYVSKVYQRCLSMTKDSERAQDFTHDIFIKAFNKLDAFKQQSSFSTWLYSITFNYCADQLRTSKRLLFIPLDVSLGPEPANPQVDDWQQSSLRVVRRVMEALSEDERKLLRLRYKQGLLIEEIARLYGLKPSAVKMRLKSSRDKIQRLSKPLLDA